MMGPFHDDRGEVSRAGRSLMLAFQRFRVSVISRSNACFFCGVGRARVLGENLVGLRRVGQSNGMGGSASVLAVSAMTW